MPAGRQSTRVFRLVVVQLSDALQYIFGKCFGRSPIAPDICPERTVEGWAGGVGGALFPLLLYLNAEPLASVLMTCILAKIHSISMR